MSFFDKKNAIDAASKKRAGGKAAAGMAAAAVAAGGAVLASEAGAAALANVGSFALNDDGSVTVTYTDGSTATYAAGSFEIIGNEVHVGSSGALLAGGTAGLALLAFLALSGGEEAAASASAAAAATTTAAPATTTTTTAPTTTAPAAGTFTASGFTGGDFTGVTATAVDASDPDVDGTDGNDIFTIASSSAAPATLEGMAGDDKVVFTGSETSLELANPSTAAPATVIEGIEEVEVSPATGSVTGNIEVKLDNNDDVKLVDVDLYSGSVTVDKLDDGDRVEVDADATSFVLTSMGGTEDKAIVLAMEGSTLTAVTDSANALETLTLESTVADSIVSDIASTSLKTLNLGGDKKLTVTSGTAPVDLATIDASNSTGGVVVMTNPLSVDIATITGGSGGDTFTEDLTGQTVDFTASLGEGDDTLILTAGVAGKDITVDAGAGKDTIDLAGLTAAGDVTLTGGEGVDTFKLDDGTAGTINVPTVIISDFAAGTTGDVLDLDGLSSAVAAAVKLASEPATAAALTTGTLNIIEYNTMNIDSVTDMAADLSAAYTVAANDQAYFIVDDGSNAAVWHMVTTDTTIDVADLTLIATLNGVTDVTTLTSENLSDFTIA